MRSTAPVCAWHYSAGYVCPDNVNARIVSKGERVSIQLMKAVMEAKSLPANLIDPVKYLLAKAIILKLWWMWKPLLNVQTIAIATTACQHHAWFYCG